MGQHLYGVAVYQCVKWLTANEVQKKLVESVISDGCILQCFMTATIYLFLPQSWGTFMTTNPKQKYIHIHIHVKQPILPGQPTQPVCKTLHHLVVWWLQAVGVDHNSIKNVKTIKRKVCAIINDLRHMAVGSKNISHFWCGCKLAQLYTI